MTVYLILFIILIILLVALYFAFRLYRKEKKLRLEAETHNEFLRNNMRILQDHTKAVGEIKNNRIGIDIKIKEATTSEEIDNIILDIIKSNNDRVV